MLSSLRDSLDNNPYAGVGTSLGGCLLSLSEALSPLLRFIILILSTTTAISVAYIQFNKARRVWYGEKNSRKKDNSNTR